MGRRSSFPGVVVVCLIAIPYCVAAEPRDYDKRAAAALFTLNKPQVGGKWDFAKAETIGEKDMENLNLYHYPPRDDGYGYGLNFGKGKYAGAYKIEVGYVDFGKNLKEKDKPLWKAHPSNDLKDPTKAEFWYKDPPMPDRNHVVARRKVGGLQLSVVLFNPVEEGLDKPIKLANDKLNDLVFMAQQYRLFAGGKIRQMALADDGKSDLGEVSEHAEKFSLGAKPKNLSVRVEVLDEDGKLNTAVKELSVEVVGVLAPQVKVEVPGARREGSRYVLDDAKVPQLIVKLTLPASTPELDAMLMQSLKTDPVPVHIKAGAKLK